MLTKTCRLVFNNLFLLWLQIVLQTLALYLKHLWLLDKHPLKISVQLKTHFPSLVRSPNFFLSLFFVRKGGKKT